MHFSNVMSHVMVLFLFIPFKACKRPVSEWCCWGLPGAKAQVVATCRADGKRLLMSVAPPGTYMPWWGVPGAGQGPTGGGEMMSSLKAPCQKDTVCCTGVCVCVCACICVRTWGTVKEEGEQSARISTAEVVMSAA